MEWAVLGLVLFGLLLTYIIFQETRAHRHWRGLVAKGDVSAVQTLLVQEFDRWQRIRVPKGTAPVLWHGVQTVELAAAGARAALVTCLAEGEYRIVAGRPQETTPPLEAAKRLAAKVVEMVMYDVPNIRLSEVRVDVYTTVAGDDGLPTQGCILSVIADRATVDDLDWDELRGAEVIERLEARYEVDDRGRAQPFDPGPPPEGCMPVSSVDSPGSRLEPLPADFD